MTFGSNAEILTENLKLLLKTPQEALAMIEAMSPADRAQVSPEWIARAKASTAADPWMHGFTVVHRETGAVVGSCGYAGPPSPDASIEIAYGIDPDHQRRGYATEAARALIAFALESGQVKLVYAYTRPEKNASTRVLTKCGFEPVGEVIHPEDGLVWRWELQQPTPSD